MEPRPKPNEQICHEACEWFVEFRAGEPDEPTRKAFHAWLQASPAHMAAYFDVTASWTETGSRQLAEQWPMERLVAEAGQDPDVVVPHPASLHVTAASAQGKPSSAGDQQAVRGVSRRRMWVRALAACGVASVCLGFGATWLNGVLGYSTGVGEQRSLLLADGSTVSLNSRSRIRVHYSTRERAIELVQGQALFSVARDPTRAFIVHTGTAEVRAVGTAFDIYQKADGTTVTVLEGRVAVRDVNTAVSGTTLGEGQQVTLGPGSASPPAAANLPQVTAWTHRQLIFDSTPLAQVAREFNRYNVRQLEIGDRELNALEIDGVFSSTDPAALLRFLRSRPDVVVSETGNTIRVTRRWR